MKKFYFDNIDGKVDTNNTDAESPKEEFPEKAETEDKTDMTGGTEDPNEELKLTYRTAESLYMPDLNPKEQRSNGTDVYAFIRDSINKGQIDEAEQALNSVGENDRTAEWHYLQACVFIAKGRYFDAYQSSYRAHKAEKNNEEYKELYESMDKRINYGYNNNADQTKTHSSSGGCDCCHCFPFLNPLCIDKICDIISVCGK